MVNSHRTSSFIGSIAKGPVRARAKHAAPSIPCLAWQASRRKFAFGATAVAMSAMLAMPNVAFAATYLEVNGAGYHAADGAASGEGWAWDGADDMTLSGYDGGYIYAEGDLNITLEGENVIDSTPPEDAPNWYGTALDVLDSDTQEGNLTIKGEGSLEVNGHDDWGIYVEDGDLVVDGTNVSVNVESSGDGTAVYAGGDMEINDSTVDVSISNTATDAADDFVGIYSRGSLEMTKSDLSVEVVSGGDSGDIQTSSNGDIVVVNSNLDMSIEGGEAAMAIATSNGNVSVTDSSVAIDMQASQAAAGIIANLSGDIGNVDIAGSEVSIVSKLDPVEYENSVALGIYAPMGSIALEDSDVSLENEGGALGTGIYASFEPAAGMTDAADDPLAPEHEAPVVAIKNSDVRVSGYAEAAITSVYYHEVEEGDAFDAKTAKQGKIAIENSVISTPANGRVQDVLVWEGSDGAAGGAETSGVWHYGQTIGTGSSVIESWDDADIARDVVIESADTVISRTQNGLASTGDASNAMPLIAAGLTAAAAAAFVRRTSAE